jgi:hypothetical protein
MELRICIYIYIYIYIYIHIHIHIYTYIYTHDIRVLMYFQYISTHTENLLENDRISTRNLSKSF